MNPFDIQHPSSDELAAHFGTRNWVIARRTKNIIARYGENVVCVSQAGYVKAEQAIYEKRGYARPAEKVIRDLLKFTPACVTRTAAEELLKQART